MLKYILKLQKIEFNSEQMNNRLKRAEKTVDFFQCVFDVIEMEESKITNNKEANLVNSKPINNEENKKYKNNSNNKYNTMTIDLKMAQSIIERCKPVTIDGVDVKPIAIKKSLPVDIFDKMTVRILKEPNRFSDKVIIYSAFDKKVVMSGEIVNDGDFKCLVFSSDNIDYNRLEKKEGFVFALLPIDDSENFYFVSDKDVIVKMTELETTNKVLCIDFGTSNTTAGSYGILDEFGSNPEPVQFIDSTSNLDKIRSVYTLPTMIYVDSCVNNEIKYKFGYDAQKELIDNDFAPKGSFFSELKRWITSMDEMIKVHGADAERYTMKITHRDLITAYIQHVINLSERFFKVKFKVIHFSAPVKLKEIFIQEMTNIFGDRYNILSCEESLDEGMAVIYDSISREESLSDLNSKKSVLVFDCGGGTTDLAKCDYIVKNDAFGKAIDMKIGYVNGNSNFGGNNVTYRIMQILKIKLANKITGNKSINSDILSLIPQTADDIMLRIDSSPDEKNKLYKDFDNMYKRVNEYIPTDYNEETDYGSDLVNKKRNFYYLWDIAESLKIEFHNSTNRVHMNFSDDSDKKICLRNDKQYYLYIRSSYNDQLECYQNPADGLDITIKEISQALMPDLYSLLTNVLPQDSELSNYDIYKFSGQSCRIGMFKELFKEFMAGKKLRSGAVKNDLEDNVIRYKMPCLYGCIKFIQAKKTGNIDINMVYDNPNMIYTVEDVDKHQILLNKDTVKVKFERYSATEVRFLVSDINGIKNKLSYIFKTKKDVTDYEIPIGKLRSKIADATYFSDDKINSIYDQLTQFDFSDSNSIGAKILILVPSKNNYCFKLFFVLKDKANRYFLQDLCSISFEDEQLNCFFDGTH